MKITYYVHDLSFPLVEGVRKQCWMLAKVMQERGHRVTILSTSTGKKKKIYKEGIEIRYGNPFHISKCNTEVLHYLSHPSPLIIPLLLRAKAKKQIMTMNDGALNGFWRRPWDIVISPLVNAKVDILTIQTKFQKKILQQTRLRHLPLQQIAPLISLFKRSADKEKIPTLLFMSHLSRSKGIEEVLSAFCQVREKIKPLRLVICDSQIQENKYRQPIAKINRGDIIIKQKIDPQEELSKAWIYLYPLQKAQETFSIPLSLIEAIHVGTPFISTRVGAIPEYFPETYLINRRDKVQLVHKIVELLSKKKHILYLKKDIDNRKTIAQFLKLYCGEQ